LKNKTKQQMIFLPGTKSTFFHLVSFTLNTLQKSTFLT